MSWEDPKPTDDFMTLKEGSLLNACRKAIYERLKAIYFDEVFHPFFDINQIPNNPRFYAREYGVPDKHPAPGDSLYTLLKHPSPTGGSAGGGGSLFDPFPAPGIGTGANLFHLLMQRSVPHVIHSFNDPISDLIGYEDHPNDPTLPARYEWIEGVSPENEKWANGSIFKRTMTPPFDLNGWEYVGNFSGGLDTRHSPHFIKLVGPPQEGDYVVHLWRRLYDVVMSLARSFLDLTEFFNSGTWDTIRNAKSVYDTFINERQYRRPFEIAVNKDNNTLQMISLSSVFHGFIARDVKSDKYYRYIGPDVFFKDVWAFGGSGFFSMQYFVEVTDREIFNPTILTEREVRILPQDMPNIGQSFLPIYNPTEPGAYFGFHIIEDIIWLLKKMLYVEKGVEMAGSHTYEHDGYTKYVPEVGRYMREIQAGDVDFNTTDPDFLGTNQNFGYPGTWHTGYHWPQSVVTVTNRHTTGGRYFLDVGAQFAGIPFKEHIYVVIVDRYPNGNINTSNAFDVAGQVISKPPMPPLMPPGGGIREHRYQIAKGVGEFEFEFK